MTTFATYCVLPCIRDILIKGLKSSSTALSSLTYDPYATLGELALLFPQLIPGSSPWSPRSGGGLTSGKRLRTKEAISLAIGTSPRAHVFGSVVQRGLRSSAELVGCCCHDPRLNGELGMETHRLGVCGSHSLQSISIRGQQSLLYW